MLAEYILQKATSKDDPIVLAFKVGVHCTMHTQYSVHTFDTMSIICIRRLVATVRQCSALCPLQRSDRITLFRTRVQFHSRRYRLRSSC